MNRFRILRKYGRNKKLDMNENSENPYHNGLGMDKKKHTPQEARRMQNITPKNNYAKQICNKYKDGFLICQIF